MTIVEYDENGKILSVISYPVSDRYVSEIPEYQGRLFLPPGYRVDHATQYVVDNGIEERPLMGVVLGDNSMSGVPAGANVSIDGVNYRADGTDIEFEFDQDRSYRVVVSLWPYQNVEVTHENIPPV